MEGIISLIFDYVCLAINPMNFLKKFFPYFRFIFTNIPCFFRSRF